MEPTEPTDTGFACGPRSNIVSALVTRFSEAPVAYGVGEGYILEVWASEGGTTWTALISNPEGVSCVIGLGESWRQIAPKADAPATL